MPSPAPLVSVIIPAYNQPGFLQEAMSSVANQTCSDLELLVVDDGSPTDLEPAFLEAAAGDPRLHYLRQPNAGGSAARNHGIREARGKWLAFLDHDDVWKSEKLTKQLAWAEQANAGLVFCSYRRFGSKKDEAPFPQNAPAEVQLTDLLRRTLIRTLSVVLVRRDVLPQSEWFRPDLRVCNDIELYYRLATKTRIAFLPDALTEKREHANNVSGNALASHMEMVSIVEELIAGPNAGDQDLTKLGRNRLQRHLLGAAKAARRAGQTEQAAHLYRRAARNLPWSHRPWLGYAAARLGI